MAASEREVFAKEFIVYQSSKAVIQNLSNNIVKGFIFNKVAG